MRHYHALKNQTFRSIINVEQVAALPEANVETTGDAVPVVDLTQLGHFKLLGNGNISKPLIIKARFVSAKAEKK